MKVIITVLSILSLSACQNNKTQSIASNDVKPQDSIQNIGGQTDEHGCYIAAGYTWSQLKNDCIRLFEDGIALENLNTTDTYHTAAYLIIDSLQKKAEIFVPSSHESILLTQQNDSTFSNGTFLLTKENFCWTISMKNTKLYQERK